MEVGYELLFVWVQWKRLDVFDLLWMLNFDTGALLRKKPAHLTTSIAYLYLDYFQPRLALFFPGSSRSWSNVLVGPHRLINLHKQRHEAGVDLLALQAAARLRYWDVHRSLEWQ